MPLLMTLAGPRNLGRTMPRPFGIGRVLPRPFSGASDSSWAYPVMIIGGLIVGGWLAHKKRSTGVRGLKDGREPPPMYHKRMGPPPGVPMPPRSLKGRRRRKR